MNKHASQPRAIYYVVALQIWEYFSFYGMRALLILYLTNQLKYSDNHAYELFSAYCSLVYVTPILGGFLADKVLGNRMAVMLGALLMAIGHVVLGASEIHPSFLYLSLAIIVCGYGLFKSNVSCLLGELYEPTDPRRDGGFSLMYAAGNVGSIIAPIACGFAQEEYSWAMGFGLMSAGFCILTLSARWSAMYGHSSLPLMVLGLAVMGFAELFIDPVAMSQITRIEIPGVTGVLTGIYMLLSGAIANYLAGVIADQTSQASFDASGAINYSINAYIEVFDQITWGALACVGLVLMIWLYQALKFRNRALALES